MLNIAIQGLGAAGQARLRACEEVFNVRLGGVISRRAGLGTLSLNAALQSPDIHAIAISLENTQHETAVAQALEAKKHVLCDYPLATSGKAAKALFDIAKQKQCVLHVEHLALLSADHQNLKQERQSKGMIIKAQYRFTGPWNEKISDTSRTGPLGLLALPRLLQISDALGPLQIRSHDLQVSSERFSLKIDCLLKDGGQLEFIDERWHGAKRSRHLKAECEEGFIEWTAGKAQSGLFAQDLAWFRDRILKNQAAYYQEVDMLALIEGLSERR